VFRDRLSNLLKPSVNVKKFFEANLFFFHPPNAEKLGGVKWDAVYNNYHPYRQYLFLSTTTLFLNTTKNTP